MCPYCGVSAVPEQRFCARCGRPLEEGAYQSAAGREYPDSDREYRKTAYQDALAPMSGRTGALLVTSLLPWLVGFIPVLGWLGEPALAIWNLLLYRRGQDIGARLLGLRVVRHTGELAGFFHMWTRNLASILSLVVAGAGYWTAYSDPHRQTWHDKMMRTYVVDNTREMDERPGTSSAAAVAAFWISLPVILGIAIWAIAWGIGTLRDYY